MKTPPESPWTRRHFPPRQERCRWPVEKSNRRFRKTPCRLRGEKRVAAGGEEPVGGPDEIKRRDSGRFLPAWLIQFRSRDPLKADWDIIDLYGVAISNVGDGA